MQILVICLCIVAFLPLLAKVPLAIAMNKAGGYDNAHPRAQQASLTGFGARALAAHQNAFEALLFFATGALTAIATGNISDNVEWAAMIFVVCRIAYNVLYLLNLHLLRSLSWGLGGVCSFYILIQAAL